MVRNAPTQSVYGPDVRPGFDPIESFVADLERLYGDALLFFHDRHGGTVIGGIWNPIKEQSRNLKALLGYSTKPTGSEVSLQYGTGYAGAEWQSGLVAVNKAAVLAEIARLGEGLVERIQTREKSLA